MQLTYRGQQYQAQTSDMDIAETGTTATYRGVSYPLESHQRAPRKHPI